MYNFHYTFAELLHVFFALRSPMVEIKTYEQFAQTLQVARRTVAGWFTGDYTPRSPDVIVRLGQLLELTVLEIDLLLYAVNPQWVRFGTPLKMLKTFEVVRYREHVVDSSASPPSEPPAIAEIERTWRVFFEDDFDTNYRQWGLGFKDDGLCTVERSIHEQQLLLTVHNRFSGIAFLGADSSCFAPATFCISVYAKLIEGATDDASYALIFEEISDNCHAVMRVRERLQQVSVVQTLDGTNGFAIYLNRVPAPSIRVGSFNKLTVVAKNNNHWFYINNAFVEHSSIPRLARARLDLGVAAGRDQIVTCAFKHFSVRIPPDLSSH